MEWHPDLGCSVGLLIFFAGTMRKTAWKGILILLLVGGVHGADAQPAAEESPFCTEKARRTATVDTRGLGAVYCSTSALLARPLRVAHATAYPVFFGAVPVAWGAAAVRPGDDMSDAYRLTITQGTTYGLVLGLKYTVGRPRPYVRRALTSRSERYGPSKGAGYTSFPSGHAALSAALATSWGLSYPHWYVVGPGAVWAVAVSASRLHLGLHYPSDVLVGSALGAGVAILVHHLRGSITPAPVRGDPVPPTPITIRIPL